MGGRPPDRSVRNAGVRLLFVASFDTARLGDVRRHVDQVARGCGLDADTRADFVTAVNEMMTNAIRHGGGRGELRLTVADRISCEVRDHGPGFAAEDYVDRRDRPSPSPDGGMGLWIVQRTTETMAIESGPTGTTVRISASLPAADRTG
ncbi:MAG TPA: ATP-binding protein [Micromonospora sp.]